ncbi:MAG: DUF4384 domain-containing protein [Pyrinomonadaceae bacterium]
MKRISNIGAKAVSLAVLILTFGVIAVAQKDAGGQPQQITGDDFPRDITADIEKGKTSFVFNKKKPIFRLKRTTKRSKPVAAKPLPAKKPTARKKYQIPQVSNAPETWEQIGVTVWKLKPARSSGANTDATRALVLEPSTGTAYAAERIASDTEFNAGDYVRLSIESPRTGYLYVIDREIYENGKVGEPLLIFPSMMTRGGKNFVQPGVVTDIPDQSDRVPYFTLVSNALLRGELLTIIVSPEPLVDIPVPAKPSYIDAELLSALEDKFLKDVSEYEQDGTAGMSYTKAEKQSAEAGTRQLTLADPFPQTVYRVKAGPKEILMINLRLIVK